MWYATSTSRQFNVSQCGVKQIWCIIFTLDAKTREEVQPDPLCGSRDSKSGPHHPRGFTDGFEKSSVQARSVHAQIIPAARTGLWVWAPKRQSSTSKLMSWPIQQKLTMIHALHDSGSLDGRPSPDIVQVASGGLPQCDHSFRLHYLRVLVAVAAGERAQAASGLKGWATPFIPSHHRTLSSVLSAKRRAKVSGNSAPHSANGPASQRLVQHIESRRLRGAATHPFGN